MGKVPVDEDSPAGLGMRIIRDKYLEIQRLLEQLDALGENVTDIDGYALHIKGESFEIHPETGIQEV